MRIPGPKWGAGRPPLETPKSSLARQIWPNSSPLARLELRCRWGKRERVRARHGRRTSTASGWGLRPLAPHVPRWGTFAGHARLLGASPPCPPRSPLGDVCRSCAPIGGFAPLPPAFPVGGRLPVMRAYWGLRPLSPKVPKREKFAGHARRRMGQRSKRLLRATPTQISRKLLPRKRLGVPSLPSRGCAEGTLARPPAGNPKGGAALFGQSLPTFCWPESRGPARPERVEGKNYNFNRRKEDRKKPPATASKGKSKILREGKEDKKSPAPRQGET